MYKTLTFSIGVDPSTLPTAQQKGIRIIKVYGRMMPMFYEKKNVRDAHALLFREFRKNVPGAPIEGPVILSVLYKFPFQKSAPKKSMVDGTPMLQRPDVDNTQKLLQDVMTEAGFWHDDSQIWDLHLTKVRTTQTPSIDVSVTYDDNL